MSHEEFKLMPYGFVKKYGAILFFVDKTRKMEHEEHNKTMHGYFDSVRRLQRLMTNEEKEEFQR